tara:strand:- start:2064 stop:2981 length:918 start_codon:yes stop_codon:yes gene_type:complete
MEETIMPINELDITFGNAHGGLVESGLAIYQKKVTLSSGMRHTMMAVDVFDDSMILHQFPANAMIEFYISAQPIIYSEMAFGPVNAYANRGPQAAEENILYKSIFLKEGNMFKVDEFPNQVLGATPTFNWYSPQVYLTMLVHGVDEVDIPDNLALSVYMAVKETSAGAVEYGMGMLTEVLSAQTRTKTVDMYQIKSALNVGLSFPSWKFGGIRSEYMLRGDALADFWMNNNNQDSEKMISDAQVAIYVAAGRKMVDYDSAFGSIDPAKGAVPDWVRITNMGLGDFNFRPQFPPNKKTDAGITRML